MSHQSPYPRPSTPISSPAAPNPKADQIAHRLFNKLVLVVADARATNNNDTDDRAGVQGRRDRSARPAKVDKWFNLETPDLESHKPALALYKSISLNYISRSPPPPLHISVLLAVPPGSSNNHNAAKVLVHQFAAPGSGPSALRQTRVAPAPRYILLETHTVTLTPTTDTDAVELPQVYKQAIALFRSIYTLLRILPSWKLYRKVRRRGGGTGHLGIEVKVGAGQPYAVDDDMVAGFDAPLSQPPESLTTESISFPPISTPLGAFSIRTMYRLHPQYALESLESLLSTHFLTPPPTLTLPQPLAPQRPDPLQSPLQFTPTVASALQRQRQQSTSSVNPRVPLGESSPSSRARDMPTPHGLSASPLGSLPIRTSLPQSPAVPVPLHHFRGGSGVSPSSSSVSSRKYTPSGGGGVEFPQLPPIPSNPNRHSPSSLSIVAANQGSAGSGSPKFANFGKDVHDLPFAVGTGSGRTSGSLGRVRKESLLSNSGERGNPGPGGLPVRRPSINSIHPFKSSTVSSSPSSHSVSFRQHSPLSPQLASGPGLAGSTSATARSSTPALVPSAANPLALDKRSSTDAAVRPGSGSVETPGSALTPVIPMPTPKRYSSSFGHRYGGTGAAGTSVGSGGAGVLGSDASGSVGKGSGSIGRGGKVSSSGGLDPPPIERRTSEGFFQTTHDDDISAFVQAIDSRAPLRGGQTPPRGEDPEGDEDVDEGDENVRDLPAAEPPRQLSGPSSPIGRSRRDSRAMMTSRAEVDDTLRRMTESFAAGVGSLEGGMRARSARRDRSVSTATAAIMTPAPSQRGGGRGGFVGRRLADSDSAGAGTPEGKDSISSLGGGRRSFESDQQVVGRMELIEDDGETGDGRLTQQPTIPRSTFGREPGRKKGYLA